MAAGLLGYRFHWLRKTPSQRLFETTGAIALVQHQVCHAESRTTERVYNQARIYQHD